MSGLNMGLLGEFHTLLYDEAPLAKEEYLRGIDKKVLLKLASYMIALDPSVSKFYDWKELLNMWFRDENAEFKNKIWQRCSELERKEKAEVSLLSPVASLKFFEFAFHFSEDESIQDPLKSEVNLFKSYLQFVTNETYKQEFNKEYIERLEGKYRIAATLLIQMYSVHDFTNYNLGDIFISQLVKAYYLFEFFESQESCYHLMSSFYSNLGINDWKEYFKFIIPIIHAHSKHPSEGWTQLVVEKNENFERSCFFLESLSLKEFDTELDSDFKLLRGNPIYKLEDGVYGLISPLFVFEKIYKGLYFKLKEIHEALPGKNRVGKNFRSYYTTNFSENVLLYKILEHIYGKRDYVKFSGSDLASKNISGSPDYYIRNGNALFLFENKDIFINADIKQSYNFQIVEEEFRKKLYFEEKQEKRHPKAVLQLINNVERILTLQNEFDKSYKIESLRIYPILILHDPSFNSPGLNYIINYWFNEELNKLKEKGLDIQKVRPITIVNIDTLILYADFLNTKKATLDHLIDKYVEFGKFNEKRTYKDFEYLKATYGETLLSFSYFIDHYTNVGFKSVPARLRNKIMESIIPKQ